MKITNLGSASITVEKVALSLITWIDRERLPLTGLNMIRQVIGGIWNYQEDQMYASERKISSPPNTSFPLTLNESQYMEVTIDLIETVNNFFKDNNLLDRRNYVWLMFNTLTIDVVCTHKTYKFRPNFEIRNYMMDKYRCWYRNYEV